MAEQQLRRVRIPLFTAVAMIFSFGWYVIGGLIGLLTGPAAYVIFTRTLGGRPVT